MVGGTLRHLQSLRLMRRDGGWIKTLLEEGERTLYGNRYPFRKSADRVSAFFVRVCLKNDSGKRADASHDFSATQKAIFTLSSGRTGCTRSLLQRFLSRISHSSKSSSSM